MKRIFIIGYRATGKTTTGKMLAMDLNIPFFDLDDVITKKQGQSIEKIVEVFGWDYFRSLERDSLKSFIELKNSFVLACGGGAVSHLDLWQDLKDSLVIWLKARPSQILERIITDPLTKTQRPPLDETLSLEEEIIQKLEERNALYEKFSDFNIDTDNIGIEEVITRIKGVIHGR